MPDDLLTPDDLARMCRVPLATVYRWNSERTGPPVLRIGRHARYRRADVDVWLEGRRAHSEAS